MAEGSDFVDAEALDQIECSACGKNTVQCHRVGCEYRLAAEQRCASCCPCGDEQAAKLRTAAAKTNIRLGI